MLNNRKTIIGIIVISILSLLIFMITKTVTKLKQKERIAEQVKTLPNLSVEAVGLNKLEEWAESGKVTVIIFFNSDCDYCQYEANAIQQQLPAFAGTNLLFISEEPKEKIVAFSQEYQLDNKEGVWWLKMQPENVYKTFGDIGVPHIWIYNMEGYLVKEFRGETKVEAILEWL
jgi:thiol-disulfide isomerase/thioredoxin